MASGERTLRVEAVVLRHMDVGEADRLLTIYTRERGKLRAVAKGARKVRSRKAGHLEPFTRVALLLARGRDWWIVTQAETVDAYLPLREELLRTGFAAYVIELVDRFIYEEGQNDALYRLLVDTLGRIAAEADPFLALRYYEVRLLDLLGFRPDLFHCVQCGAEIKAEEQFFSAVQGGAVCPRCGKGLPEARPISLEALRFLRHLQRSSYREAQRAKIPPGVRAEMEAVLQHYLTFLLERGLNTPAFIRAIKH